MDQNNNNRDPDTSSARGNLDPKRLSFSQAQGYEELPAPLKLEELSDEARTQIWNLLYLSLKQSHEPYGTSVVGAWERMLRRMHCFHDNRALDDWSWDFNENRRMLRQHIESDPFNHVFDRLQFIMRDRDCPLDLRAI